MQLATGRAIARMSAPTKTAQIDPFIAAFNRYNATLQKLIELRKTYKNCTDSRQMEQVSNLWESRLDGLVRIVPTTWAGVSALVDVSLDPDSVGPDEDLLREAMNTVRAALRQLLTNGSHCAA
jgi:hypothetical protein